MNLGVREAASLLNVSEKTIYRWIQNKSLPVIRIQDQYRFNRVELLEWAISERISLSPNIFREPESQGQPLPSLVEALTAGGIFYRVDGKERDGVLRNAVRQMKLPGGVDREFLFAVLQAREDLESTGIGDGIAIPHVRNPVILHVTQPTITLCFLENAIDFGALDGNPVKVLFILLSPTVRAHLHMLSRLSFALRNDELRGLLSRQAMREDLFEVLRQIEQKFYSTRQGADS